MNKKLDCKKFMKDSVGALSNPSKNKGMRISSLISLLTTSRGAGHNTEVQSQSRQRRAIGKRSGVMEIVRTKSTDFTCSTNVLILRLLLDYVKCSVDYS